jgi:UDP-N-acetylmuramoyl-tripeptide--D-alanyl-D-alanine ligase
MVPAIKNFAQGDELEKILCLGAMAELGENSLWEHESIIRLISNYQWKDVLLVGGDFLKIDSIYKIFSTVSEAGEYLQNISTSGTSILIKGSRAMQMEKLVDYI